MAFRGPLICRSCPRLTYATAALFGFADCGAKRGWVGSSRDAVYVFHLSLLKTALQ